LDEPATADVIVVGLGAVGSAVLYQLARRKVVALGIDRFVPPHDRGSSHGETRITRQAVGEGADYVPFVRRSHRIWRELEALTGERLLEPVGALFMTPKHQAASLHHGVDFVRATIATAQQFGIEHEVLDSRDIAGRFPQFKVGPDMLGYFEPDGGFLRPEACIATQLDLARRHGARTRLGEAVLAVDQPGERVTVRTDRREYQAKQVVLAAGAWLPGLLGGWYRETLMVRRQVLYWFAVDQPALWQMELSPVFIWVDGSRAEDCCYGFPMLTGAGAVKLGSEQDRETTDPDAVLPVRPEEIRAIHQMHVAPRLNGIGSACIKASTCCYTVAPRHRFLVERHPEMPAVTVVSACSGHGFKHSAALGEAVAQAIVGESDGLDLAVFSRAGAS